VVSLRRTGHPLRARKILRWTLLVAAVLAVALILLPDGLGRIVGFAAEIAFYSVYPKLQDAEFAQWQQANPGMVPSSGWGAVGWGLLGLVLFVVVAIVVGIPLMMLFPSP
jgi:hypothetical protein